MSKVFFIVALRAEQVLDILKKNCCRVSNGGGVFYVNSAGGGGPAATAVSILINFHQATL